MKVKYEYCPKCGTVNKVIWVNSGMALPKECRCKAEASDHEYVTDEELLTGIETAMKEEE